LSNEELLKELRERTIHQFLDIIVLEALHDSSNPISGRELANLIHKKFGILIDSGIIHSILFAMERKNLIRGFNKEILEKRINRFYKLTESGKELSEELMNNRQDIINFIKLLFKGNTKLILQ
jgi:DNA-binding PadR family transcriptional regulator